MYTQLNKKINDKQKVKKQDRIKRFETKPIEGYQEHYNKVTGESFPYCCETHKLLYEQLKEICIEPHLTYLPQKLVNQFAYTEYFIVNRINNEDWYKDLTDYIIYNYASFGYPAYGFFAYLMLIVQFLEQTDADIPSDKRKRIIEFIEPYLYKEKQQDWGAQLEILYSTYKRWLNLFPFELKRYFEEAGMFFSKALPFLYITEEKKNPYLGIYIPQIHSKSTLMSGLKNITNDLLTKINGTVLVENGLIVNTDLVKFELAINSRKQKLKKGYYNTLDKDESRINQMIEEWFEDEKRFFNEITPLMKTLLLPRTEPKNTKLSLKQIALIHIYEGSQITRENADALAENYGYTSKFSGEALFQGYIKYCSPANRKGLPTLCTTKKLNNKISLFKSITELLSDKAERWANDEIKILETLYKSDY